jgi:hypothetical protein
LVQAGFDPSRIEVHAHGTPRLAIAVEPGEAAEVERLIDAVEGTDPDGFPSFWDLALVHHFSTPVEALPSAETPQLQSTSFVVGWRPLDDRREIIQATTDLHLKEAYVERGD